MRIDIYLGLIALLLSTACQPGVNYKEMPLRDGDAYNMVVEIPAGTNAKVEYQPGRGQFVIDQENGKDRIIDFLPYPGNYGFLPNTMMDKRRGGDGDALDVLLLSSSLPTGTIVKVLPVAALLLRDSGELDTKIIVIPAEPERRIMEVSSFEELMIDYDAAKRSIQDWFLNYKGPNQMELIRWEDAAYAEKEIKKWSTS